jgi:hypothetical protein
MLSNIARRLIRTDASSDDSEPLLGLRGRGEALLLEDIPSL